MVQVNQWVFLMVMGIVLPLLKGLIPGLKAEAAKTETPIDDAMVGAFEVVITALDTGGVITPKK